jgi:hypothetical protein
MTPRRLARAGLLMIAAAVCASCSGGSPTEAGGGAAFVTDFSGFYSGTYRMTDCVAEGAFVGFCEASGIPSDDTYPIQLSVNQTQSTATGTVVLGSFSGTFEGTASGNTLSGTAVMADMTNEGLTLKTSITAWSTTISENALSGGFTLVFRTTTLQGSATVTAVILQLAR